MLAIGLRLTAIFCFVIMSAIVKEISDRVPPGQAVFFRSFFAIPVILIWITARGELRHALVTQNRHLHFIRGLIGTTAMGLTFAGLGRLPLPESTAIGFAAPIFTVILAAIFLGERIRLIRIMAVLLGLVGVLIMLWPRFSAGQGMQDTATLGAVLILCATLTRSFVQIHIRQMVKTEHTAAIVFYFSCTAAILSLLTLPFGWVVPDLGTVALMIATGLIGGVAQILVTSSFRFAPASMLAPYDYASMLFSILIGYFWFSEVPTAVMLAGAMLVILGNVVVIWRESQLGLERGKARSATDPKA
jgi:drug/metabolite transporter (DMT)-like permease